MHQQLSYNTRETDIVLIMFPNSSPGIIICVISGAVTCSRRNLRASSWMELDVSNTMMTKLKLSC